jgi:ketosteroid isomerase-like protein
MSGLEDTVRELADRAEICDLLLAYFTAVDSADRDAMVKAYTDDCCLAHDGVPVAKSLAEIRAMLVNWPKPAADSDAPWADIGMSHHIMGAPLIRVEGDVAWAESNGISHLAEGGNVRVRALRYMDKLRRTSDGWRIYDRVHVADMEMMVAAEHATTYAERVTWASSANGAG